MRLFCLCRIIFGAAATAAAAAATAAAIVTAATAAVTAVIRLYWSTAQKQHRNFLYVTSFVSFVLKPN